MTYINDTIKHRRLELGLTMREVADRCHVSEATVSRWESGDIENMKRDKIVSLANALHLPPAVIMGWEDVDETHLHTFPAEVERLASILNERIEMRVLFDAECDLCNEDIFKLLDIIKQIKQHPHARVAIQFDED